MNLSEQLKAGKVRLTGGPLAGETADERDFNGRDFAYAIARGDHIDTAHYVLEMTPRRKWSARWRTTTTCRCNT